MDGADHIQDNVQDKTFTGPMNQSEMPKTKVDSGEEWTTEPEYGNDNDSEEENGHTRTKKRLFVCCDGTWQNAASSMRYSTNVARFARCVDRLEPDGFDRTLEDGTAIKDHVMQVVWYSGGVGTYASLVTESTWSGLTGAGVTSCILNAYYFLSSNYNFGCHKDEIILVGYSRGAFTVRCLAEFISKVGLLRRVALPFLGLLFQLWVDGKEEELEQLKKKLAPPMKCNRGVDGALLHPVKIKALAEFDPVSAMVNPFQWFRNKNKGIASVQDQVPSKVENAFLAMALNEKRSEFKPMLWKRKSPRQVVRQCAFLGCHGDIGGGNADSGLSQLPLLWMVSQVSQATIDVTRSGSKAQFDENLLLQFATPSAVGYPREINRATSARDELSLFETFSSTKGEITESLTLPWKAFYFFKRPLTLWYGQGGSDRVMTIEPSGSGTAQAIQDGSHEEGVNDQHVCRLEVHFSVHMLHKKRSERQQESEAEGTFLYHLGPLQGYNRELKQEKDPHAGAKEHKHFAWEKTSSTSKPSSRGYCFEEQVPGELEKNLLRGWVERAELWWKHSSEAAGPDQPPEEGVEAVNAWLRFIKSWDSRIDLESNKKQTLVFFFKEMLQKDELFKPSSLGSASSAAPVSSSSSSDPKIPEDRKITRRSESPKGARIENRKKVMRSSGSRNRRVESRRAQDDSGRAKKARTPRST